MRFFLFSLFISFLNIAHSVNKTELLLDLAGFSSTESKNIKFKGFGTGFAITPDGHIVSASHVTEGSDIVRVILKNGKHFEAKVITEELGLDLVLLKINETTPSYLSVTNRTSGLGDDIYTVGYPSPETLGFNQKFTKGSISAITGLHDDSFRYQISIPIQPGNSGGAVVCEESGEVVGIVVSTLKGKEVVGFDPQNVNYALKSAFIKPILDSFELKQSKLQQNELSANEKRRKVVNATCMIVSGNFVDAGQAIIEKEETVQKDNSPPILRLLGSNPLIVTLGEKYTEPGVISDIEKEVLVNGDVNIFKIGVYKINYSVTSKEGVTTKAQRIVFVLPNSSPETKTKKDPSKDQVQLIVNLPENNHGGTLGAAIALGSYKLGVYLDGRNIGFIPSGVKSGAFSFSGSGERMVRVTLEQTAFLGLSKTQKNIYSNLFQFKKGRNEIWINGNLFFR
jgi:S1-C subfamily serine protease